MSKIEKVSPEALLHLAKEVLSTSADFNYISGEQPFFMSYKDVKYYVYIKNLSSAYFEGREATTRAQLPRRAEFDEIKNSPHHFLFLGYDADNDVYVCWDYNVAKQRLNATSNVSFYSRSHFQQSVKQGEFTRGTLKNGDTPVLFKRQDLVSFFDQIDTFFSVDSAPSLPITRSVIKSHNYHSEFEAYILSSNLSQSTCTKYSTAIEGRVSEGVSTYITKKVTELFRVNDINTLEKWKEQLFVTPEFEELDRVGKKMYSCALVKYIDFNRSMITPKATPNYTSDIPATKPASIPSASADKLTHIDDEELLQRIKSMVESHRILQAAQEIAKHYLHQYPKMTLSDWMSLAKNINNKDSLIEPKPQEKSTSKKKSKTQIIKVTLPSGSVICEPKVLTTLIKVVEYAGVEEVRELGIYLNKVNLISDTIVPMYQSGTKPIGNGLYIMTVCDTNTKCRVIKQISDRLGLNLQVELVPCEGY